MKTILGILIMIFGILLGLYVGLYLCIFCGGVDVINAVQMHPIPAGTVIWGLMRVFLLGGISGWGAFAVVFFIGLGIFRD